MSKINRTVLHKSVPTLNTFDNGGTVRESTDVFTLGSKWYMWFGEVPHTVPAGSTPETSGGESSTAWVCINPDVEIPEDTTVTHAEDAGILTTNTGTQNTDALIALRESKRTHLVLGEGVYQFNVFKTAGLTGVTGQGKNKTILELHGVTSPVSVQPSDILIQGIHFKSVAGRTKWSRIGMGNGTHLKDCKITDFTDDPDHPDSWGVYFKNVRGCRLTNCEFNNNTQSDIAILEGTTDLIIESCYSSTDSLIINFEPNVGTPEQNGIVVINSKIHKLYLLCNDASTKPDSVATFIGCTIDDLQYDGLGSTFSRCKILGYTNQPDVRGRVFGSTVHGLTVSPVEMLEDPEFSCVGGTGSKAPWEMRYSSAAPSDRYNRNKKGELVISLNTASSTSVHTQFVPCKPSTPYLITLEKYLLVNAGRPDIIRIDFYGTGSERIEGFYLNRFASSTLDRQQHVIVSSAGCTRFRLTVMGGDTTSVLQTVCYRFASVREVVSSGVDSSSVTSPVRGYVSPRVKVPSTYRNFYANQLYYAPVTVGTEVEFMYEAGEPRLCVCTVQGTDCTSRMGTLRVISNYP